MQGIFMLGTAVSFLVVTVSVWLKVQRAGWRATNEEARAEAQRLNPVLLAAGLFGLACIVGWAMTT